MRLTGSRKKKKKKIAQGWSQSLLDYHTAKHIQVVLVWLGVFADIFFSPLCTLASRDCRNHCFNVNVEKKKM